MHSALDIASTSIDAISSLRIIYELDDEQMNAEQVLTPALSVSRPLVYCISSAAVATSTPQSSPRIWKLMFDQWLDAIRQKILLTRPA